MLLNKTAGSLRAGTVPPIYVSPDAGRSVPITQACWTTLDKRYRSFSIVADDTADLFLLSFVCLWLGCQMSRAETFGLGQNSEGTLRALASIQGWMPLTS